MLLRKFKNISLVFIFLLIQICPAFSDDLLFQMNSAHIPYYKSNQIYAVWNPKRTQEFISLGLKILFFGKGQNCLNDMKNGPVKIYNSTYYDVENLTGLSKKGDGKIFVPIQDKDLCNVQGNLLEGGSFVYINEAPYEGGIGLFTASGRDERGELYFFQPRDKEGIGSGVNKYLKGTNPTWRFEKEKLYPFNNQKSLKIYVKSSVVKLPQIHSRPEPVQVRQQIEIGFANKSCLFEKKEEKNLCLVKYVFDFLVKRWGDQPLDISRDAVIYLDPGQGGLPHISAYSKPAGRKIIEKLSDLEVAISCGEGLQETTFRDKIFCYVIEWQQFQNGLRAIASKKLKKPVDNITDDLRKLFGSNFDNPDDWYLTLVSVQHELRDPYKDRNVFIGGNIKEIKLLRQ